MLRPAMPVIVDKLAHAFWANVHIATVHKHNGVEHVHYELRKMSEEDGKSKSALKRHAIEDVDQFPATVIQLPTLPIYSRLQDIGYCFYLMPCYAAVQSCDYPPPKAA